MEEEEEESHDQNLLECLNYPPLYLVSNRPDPFSTIDFSPSDHDRHSGVFPPVNHEDLHIPTISYQDDDAKQNDRPPSSISLDRVATNVPERLPAVTSDAGRWCWSRKLFYLLGCKMIKIGVSIRTSVTPRARMLFRFNSSASLTAALLFVLVLLFRSRWHLRLRRREESRDHLIRLIKDKDEKINQLLRQIAQMNELLLPKLIR